MMFDKIKDKDYIMRLVAILLITSIGILSLTILSSNNDGRKQIIDRDGGEESKLCAALSNIKGVGEVEVMVEYDKDSNISGVIVIAEGGSNPIIANDLTRGVSTLYNIPTSSVIVFEKEQGEWLWKNLAIKT